jgi:hypothetical protein
MWRMSRRRNQGVIQRFHSQEKNKQKHKMPKNKSHRKCPKTYVKITIKIC